jgi:HAD superfamily hydrolase (TIGR01662 family)
MIWLFFDIGSTLIDETACYEKRFREISAAAAVSYDTIYETALAFYKKGEKGDHACAKQYGVSLPKWHHELETPYADAIDTVQCLKSRGYRLGIIANQGLGTESRLKTFGLQEYFDIILSSAEEGVAKPDPVIFLRALDRACCKPQDAYMIGDRLDNDIIPAKALGMKTIRILQGFGTYAIPRSDAETPDTTVTLLSDLLHIFP